MPRQYLKPFTQNPGYPLITSLLNTIRIVLKRGYLATTAENPRHYGMPPFQQILSNEEIALVVTFIRNESKNSRNQLIAVDVDGSKGWSWKADSRQNQMSHHSVAAIDS